FAYANARPRPCLIGEIQLFTFANAGDLRHLSFQLLISLSKLGDFPEKVLNPAVQVLPLRLLRAKPALQFRPDALDFERLPLARDLCGGFQFPDPRTERLKLLPVTLLDLGSPLVEFSFEASPGALVLMIVFVLEQAEGFLCAQLCNAGEVLDAKAVENLSPFQLAFAQAKRAFDGFGRHRQLGGHAITTLLKLCWHSIGAGSGTSRQSVARFRKSVLLGRRRG